MSVVVDASPLIFLAKLRRLDLVPRVLGREIRVAESVRGEALSPRVDSREADVLTAFFARCSVETVRSHRRFAAALSQADNDTLALALRCRATLLLCDDRVVRAVAEAEGIRVLGTLGLLLRTMREKHISPSETRQSVDSLVRLHNFRVSVEVYQSALAQIAANEQA